MTSESVTNPDTKTSYSRAILKQLFEEILLLLLTESTTHLKPTEYPLTQLSVSGLSIFLEHLLGTDSDSRRINIIQISVHQRKQLIHKIKIGNFALLPKIQAYFFPIGKYDAMYTRKYYLPLII